MMECFGPDVGPVEMVLVLVLAWLGFIVVFSATILYCLATGKYTSPA